MEQGVLIDSRKLDLAVRNIKYAGLVKDEREESTGELKRAAVNVRPFARDDGVADLYIDVNEAETGSLMIGASVNSNGEIAGTVEFSQRNFDLFGFPRSWSDWTNAFTGGGQTLSISATFGTLTDVFKIDFEEPYFLGLPLRLKVQLFDVVSRKEYYTEGRRGAGITLGHSWSLHRYKRRRLSLAARWRDEVVSISNVGAGAITEVFAAEGESQISRTGLVLSYESRDNPLMPSSGSRFMLSSDYAGGPFGGTYEFLKSRVEYQHHVSVKRDKNEQPSVLQFKISADHVEVEGSGTIVPFYERNYAGGFGTIRGFDHRSVGPMDGATGQPLGGRVRLLGTVEYTFPLSGDSSLRGAIFYDAGQVYDNDSVVYLDQLKQSAGVGLLIQPAGFPMPISLYLGWIINRQPEDDDQVVSFMIGTMFF
jgi:outer membrane protein insertion porin family